MTCALGCDLAKVQADPNPDITAICFDCRQLFWKARQAPDPQRACNGKRRYDTEKIADSVRERAWFERRTALRTYACTSCGGYHLTRQSASIPEHLQWQQNPGWRPPAKSARQEAEERKRERRQGRSNRRHDRAR